MTRRSVPREGVGAPDGAGLSFELGIGAENAPDRERTLRKTFLTAHKQRVSTRKEFFKVSLAYVRSEAEQMDVETQWTVEAAAGEYPESLATERALVEDQEMRDEWLLNNLSDLEDIPQSTDSDDYAISLPH
jgi:hypothetical protein